MGFKEAAATLSKRFITELSLEYNHKVVLTAVSTFCQQFTPDSLKQLIVQGKPPANLTAVIEFLAKRKDLIKEYSVESLAKRFAELICEARPDLEEVFYSCGDEGGEWLYGCAKLIRERALNPIQFMAEQEKSEIASIVCDKCNKVIIVPRKDIESLKQCPYCGAGKEE